MTGTVRRLRRLAGGLSAALILTVLPPGTAGAGPAPGAWPSVDYNAARSNFNPQETALTTASVDQVEYERGYVLRPGNGECTPPPYHDDDRPVVIGRVMYAASLSSLVAVDLTSGAEIWRTAINPFGDRTTRGIGVSGSHLLLGVSDCISQSDPSGRIAAYDIATGDQVWDTFVPVLSAMAVSGDRVITSGSSPGAGEFIAVYDATTGGLVWSRTSNGCTAELALVVGGHVLAQCEHPVQLVALALSDGHPDWQRAGRWQPMAGDTDATTARSLYLRSPTGSLVSMSPSTGNVDWTRPSEHGPVHAVGGTRLYVTCDGTALCALDRRTGIRLWTSPRTVAAASVVVAADVLYPAPAPAPLVAATGTTIALGPAPDYPQGDQLVVADGRIVSTESGSRAVDVYALP